jgi:hypothetical protein
MLQKSDIRVASIKCNYHTSPVGVGEHPSFSWILESKKRNQYQSAYQVIVSEKKNHLNTDDREVWNSGKVLSGQSIGLVFNNLRLKPGTKYSWKVKVWDTYGKTSGWSGTANFVTGLFDKKDWAGAEWISMEKIPDTLILVPGIPVWGRNTKNIAQRRPVIPLFRKEFIADKRLESAYLFISGIGHYKAFINGHQISHDLLSPGWTHYQKTCQYNTYDITRNIRKGPNAIGIIVGNGFHNINNERYRKLLITYGMPKVIATIFLHYADGSTESIITDSEWKTDASPITFTSIYGGETYDARLEQEGWTQSHFDDSHWQHALIARDPGGRLCPEITFPVKTMKTFYPKRIVKTGLDSFMIDFGQNASGMINLEVRGMRGDTVKIIPSELVNDDFSAHQEGTGQPYYYEYILKGEGTEIWQPMFTYYGFRYVQVYGAEPKEFSQTNNSPALIGITHNHTYNSTPLTGSFWCSDSLFNLINTLIRYAIESNLQSILTDCPHREKLGWLEQTYLMGGSIQCNYNVYHLYRKVVHDMMDAQYSNGLVPNIAPEYVHFGDVFTDSPEWGSAIVMLPWLVYKWYGDVSLMEEAWESMVNYINYLDSKAKNHILSYGLGDWYDLGPEKQGFCQLSPLASTATAIYFYDYIILARMARLLNKSSEAEVLLEKADLIRNAYNTLLFDHRKGIYASGSQTSMAIPLAMGIVEEKDRDAVLRNLVDSINARDMATTSGDIGFQFLLKALAEGDQNQLIYEMNHRDDVPGYGYQIKQGATALTESWQALPEVSNNHLMLGHLEEWLFTNLGGIRQQDNSAAYKNIIIQPAIVDGIDEVRTHYDTPYGRINSAWKKENGKVIFNLSIPVNTSATIFLPSTNPALIYDEKGSILNREYSDVEILENAYVAIKAGSGYYHFEVEKN